MIVATYSNKPVYLYCSREKNIVNNILTASNGFVINIETDQLILCMIKRLTEIKKKQTK